jgi:acyl dehydratase
MITKFYEDIEIGRRHRTRGRTITEADLVNFGGMTADWHPLHTDTQHYGSDRLRFVGLTFIGDTIHAETEVSSVTGLSITEGPSDHAGFAAAESIESSPGPRDQRRFSRA